MNESHSWRDWPRQIRFIGVGKRQLALLAILASLSGIMGAVTLVFVVRVALAIGNGEDSVDLSLGPLGRGTVTIPALLLVASCLVLASFAADTLASYASARMTSTSLGVLRKRLERAFVSAPWSIKGAEREGHLQDLLSTHCLQATSVATSLSIGVTAFFNFAALLVAALIADVLTAVAILGMMIALAAALQPLRHRHRRHANERSSASLEYAGGLAETATLIQEITVFDVEEPVLDRMDTLTQKEMRPLRRLAFGANLVPDAYQTVALLFVLAGLASLFLAGGERLAALSVVVLALLRAITYGKTLQRVATQLGQLSPFVSRLEQQVEVYDHASALLPAGERPLPRIETVAFAHVDFGYMPRRLVLKDVSFVVGRGEVIGIVGPSGAGKSTLAQLLLRLREPTSGQYLVNDLPAQSFSRADWHARVAVVPQEGRLLNASVADNVRFFREPVTQAEINRAVTMAHIAEEVNSWPKGFDTVVGARGAEVSGGQRQRLCIARALAGNPDLVVLDEPTSALDGQSESLIRETLLGLKDHVMLFIIAHRLSTLSICDRIMVIVDGRLEAFDEPTKLELENSFYGEALRLSRIS